MEEECTKLVGTEWSMSAWKKFFHPYQDWRWGVSHEAWDGRDRFPEAMIVLLLPPLPRVSSEACVGGHHSLCVRSAAPVSGCRDLPWSCDPFVCSHSALQYASFFALYTTCVLPCVTLGLSRRGARSSSSLHYALLQ